MWWQMRDPVEFFLVLLAPRRCDYSGSRLIAAGPVVPASSFPCRLRFCSLCSTLPPPPRTSLIVLPHPYCCPRPLSLDLRLFFAACAVACCRLRFSSGVLFLLRVFFCIPRPAPLIPPLPRVLSHADPFSVSSLLPFLSPALLMHAPLPLSCLCLSLLLALCFHPFPIVRECLSFRFLAPFGFQDARPITPPLHTPNVHALNEPPS